VKVKREVDVMHRLMFFIATRIIFKYFGYSLKVYFENDKKITYQWMFTVDSGRSEE
jgi:hypothetical protein